MKIHGWGKYPITHAKVNAVLTSTQVADYVLKNSSAQMIARGLGRSYGDSALAGTVIDMTKLNHFLQFDSSNGVLTCEAGLSLADILTVVVPQGWFLPVTPGTKFVTIGGAIASDIHGKNHHHSGSFSEYLDWVKIVTAEGNLISCSKEENSKLFYASCGGMGLTGIIVEAKIRLKPIQNAYIKQRMIKTDNLEETIACFESYSQMPYSVAWLDCTSDNKSLGRGIVILGEHSETRGLELRLDKRKHLTIPFNMPNVMLNRYSIKLFNSLYYQQKKVAQLIHYDRFFYPLDTIHHWNRIVGRNGFVQYQLVLPKSVGLAGISKILKLIVQSKYGSFLSAFKLLGKNNQNYLSFPIEGYTLALDFKRTPKLLKFLNQLDQLVVDYGGRIYLTKDARLGQEFFRKMYPQYKQFMQIRKQYEAHQKFHSLQSQRIGL